MASNDPIDELNELADYAGCLVIAICVIGSVVLPLFITW